MRPVRVKPSPDDFASKVGDPGTVFLAIVPVPTRQQWEANAYWRRVLPELHEAYDRTCAYTSFRIPLVTGDGTVEHFVPKTFDPPLAYVWNNYRLVCRSRNSSRARREVLDPFAIAEGTFAILFPALIVVPGAACAGNQDLTSAVNQTCIWLHLNDETGCVCRRQEYIKKYMTEDVSFVELALEAPFLASEMERNGLDDRAALKVMFPEGPAPAAKRAKGQGVGRKPSGRRGTGRTRQRGAL
jgi:hypothetical protein